MGKKGKAQVHHSSEGGVPGFGVQEMKAVQSFTGTAATINHFKFVAGMNV